MKYAILFLFLIISLFSSCVTSRYVQDADYPNPFEFHKVDSVEGTQSQLFSKANEWLAVSFNDSKSVIQMADKEAGKIVGKGVMSSQSSMGTLIGSSTFYVKYTITITAKEGRYKVDLTDFIATDMVNSDAYGGKTSSTISKPLDGNAGSLTYPKIWDNLKGDCYVQSKKLIKSLKAYMKTKGDDF